MQIPEFQKIIESGLEKQLPTLIPNHSIAKAYTWASLPPGKLFRPLLAAAIYLNHSNGNPEEFNQINSNASKMAAFLELHHSYTLVHDDMPCMDDDDLRRGKASTHKQFGQWQALLVGDGLLGASWRLVSQIKHPALLNFFKYSTWTLGPKGLLQGQVLDLSEEMTLSFENLILTHKLKTARLIQTALVGGYAISDNPNFKMAKAYHKLGEALGVSFQLLDDLTELTEKLGDHEKAVNPWLWASIKSTETLINYLEQVKELAPTDAELLQEVLAHYFGTILGKVEAQRDSILAKLNEEQLRPVESLLKILSHAK